MTEAPKAREPEAGENPGSAPKAFWRRDDPSIFFYLAVFIIALAGIAEIAFGMLEERGFISGVMSDSLTFVLWSSIMGFTVFVFRGLLITPTLRWAMLATMVFIILSSVLNVTEELDISGVLALITTKNPLNEALQQCFLVGSVCSFVTGFFSAMTALVAAHKKMKQDAETLESKVRELRQTEAQLRREYAFRRTIIEHAVEGIGVCHQVGVEPYLEFSVWNERMTEIMGYTMEEINRSGWCRALWPDRRTQVLMAERMPCVFQGEDFCNETWQITRADGEKRTVSIATSSFASEDGASHVLVSIQDITEEKRALDALKESERRFNETLRTVELIAVMLDTEANITFCNEALLRLAGWRADEVIGKNWFDTFVPAEHRDEVREVFRLAVGGGQLPLHHENQIVTRGGGRRFVKWSNTVLKNPEGQVMGTSSIGEDITERKRAEEALAGEKARFGAILSTLNVGLIVYNRDMTIAWVNEHLPHLFPYGDPIGMVCHDFFENSGEICETCVVHECFEAGEARTSEVYRPNDKRWYITIAHPMKNKGGEMVQVLESIIDITDRKRDEEERLKLEVQMQHAQKLESLGIMAGGIAHDFNNILAVVLGNAELAFGDLSVPSPARHNLEEIQKAARRAADLSNQMLAYSGRGHFIVVPLNLNEIIRETVQLLGAVISKKTTLEYVLAPKLPAIRADATQIRQIVMNIITNASEAIGDDGGTISVSTGAMPCGRAYLDATYMDDLIEEGTYVYLEVRDTGYGMDADTRRRLFDPFFTTKFTGRGLGLAAVQGIVRGHKGAIDVRSEPGRGTTFRVLFPAARGSAVVLLEEEKAPVEQSFSGLVLLVEDEQGVRNMSKEMLERMGFTVVMANDGLAAVAAFGEQPGQFTCVLLDLSMPTMDGEEAFGELRRIREDIPIIVTSGYSEQEINARFAGRGLTAFLQKPYWFESLRVVFARVLNG